MRTCGIEVTQRDRTPLGVRSAYVADDHFADLL